MANLDHLPLPRIEGQLDRRKKPGFGQPIGRDVEKHAANLTGKITAIEAARTKIERSDRGEPLLLKIVSKTPIEPNEWPRVDMQILATDPQNTVVLFAADADLRK